MIVRRYSSAASRRAAQLSLSEDSEVRDLGPEELSRAGHERVEIEQHDLIAVHFEHAVRLFGPTYTTLHECYGITTSWEAAKRVATEILLFPVTDVQLAWHIIWREKRARGEESLTEFIEAALVLWREV